MYSQYMSVYRRGYSVVGLQVNTCYKFCEPEIQSMTVVKYIFNPLEKYRVYNWRSGYIWKQGRVIQYASRKSDWRRSSRLAPRSTLTLSRNDATSLRIVLAELPGSLVGPAPCHLSGMIIYNISDHI